MKKRIAVVFIVMVLLLLGVLTFLSIPKHLSGNYMVCSIEGKVKKVELDITIHRGMGIQRTKQKINGVIPPFP